MYKKNKWFLIAAITLLLSFNLTAENLQKTKEQHRNIDIHLSVSQNIKKQIEAFNKYLDKSGILTKYNIVPFLKEGHPIHITLYLTEFDVDKISLLKAAVKQIAVDTGKFNFKTSYINPSISSFVMLEVEKNDELQKLSNKVISELARYRYKQAQIPSWAETIPAKKESFEKYGSPNAFSEFVPHMSILAGNFKSDKQKECFLTEMKELVEKYGYKPTEAEIVSIGIGFTNSYGQMTEEIANFPLN